MGDAILDHFGFEAFRQSESGKKFEAYIAAKQKHREATMNFVGTEARECRELCVQRDHHIRELYWEHHDPVPVEAIEDVYELSQRQIKEIAGGQWTTTCCAVCVDPINLFVRDRDELKLFMGLKFICKDCQDERAFILIEQRRPWDRPSRERIAALRSMPYSEYLASPEWAAKREHAFGVQGRHCQLCRSNGPLNVHHNTYERRGDELLADLFVLCADCHTIFHQFGKLADPNQAA